MTIKWPALCFVAVIAACQQADATPLLTSAHEAQLESWLGEGNLDFTNIFTKTVGDGQDSYDFHAAADGKGRTFTLIEVRELNGYQHQIIGGYNPQSWDSHGHVHFTSLDAERTAFIYNLTIGEIQRQKLDGDPNANTYDDYQTYNFDSYGPTFGGGNDIHVRGDLARGHANYATYGDGSSGPITVEPWLGGDSLWYGRIEVYTFEPAANGSPVPEPASLALMGLGGIGLVGGAARRRLRNRPA